MASETESRPNYAALILVFVTFGIVSGAAIFLFEAASGISIASWLKAVIVGIAVGLFGFIALGRVRKSSES